MKERPILFSAPMVRAILDGKKTQTRRVVKPIPPYEFALCDAKGCCCWAETGDESDEWWPNDGPLRCPYGTIGDRLWVREAYCEANDRGAEIRMPFLYRADKGLKGNKWWADKPNLKWRPSIHMPRGVSRITLEITNIRVERLQEISIEDVLKEGIPKEKTETEHWREMTADQFILLWESINGKGSWEANPWVWVIEFKRITL